jgi:hypothetical protein
VKKQEKKTKQKKRKKERKETSTSLFLDLVLDRLKNWFSFDPNLGLGDINFFLRRRSLDCQWRSLLIVILIIFVILLVIFVTLLIALLRLPFSFFTAKI